MTDLAEIEKMAREGADGERYDNGMPVGFLSTDVRLLARFILRALPVLRAAEACRDADGCKDYGFCEQCGDHCGNCTTYGEHRRDCPQRTTIEALAEAVDAFRKAGG